MSEYLTSVISQLPHQPVEEVSFLPPRVLPILPKKEPANSDDLQGFRKKLRYFFRTGSQDSVEELSHEDSLFPVLLTPFKGINKVRYDYPVWMNDYSDEDPDVVLYPLHDLLMATIDKFAPNPGDSRILKDNLSTLEEILREKLSSGSTQNAFVPIIEQAAQQLEEKLALKGNEKTTLSSDISQLQAFLPQGGALIRLTPETPFILFSRAVKSVLYSKYTPLAKEVKDLRVRLRELLMVEKNKRGEMKSPEQLAASIGGAAAYIDSSALSKILPRTSSQLMPESRKKRIEYSLEILDSFKAILMRVESIVIVPDQKESTPMPWETLFPFSDIIPVDMGKGCEKALTTFSKHMSLITKLFAAVRIARLEVEDKYSSELHDDFFKYFDWKSLTEEELCSCPPVCLIDYEENLADSGFSSLSRLLLSAMPVKVIILKKNSEILKNALDEGLNIGNFRQELGHLAVSHRKSFVSQTSVGNIQHLANSFFDGIQAWLPALFYVLSPELDRNNALDPYIWAGAAIESREFPVFVYDPQEGMQWGRRFDVAMNPQPEQHWPIYDVKILDENEQEISLSLPFTFADFASQVSSYSEHFLLVPPEFWTEDLIPLADYLKLSEEELYSKIPFIWMVDKDNILQKVVMTYELVFACRERLDSWYLIQDLGGINNYHAEIAAEKARSEARESASEEIRLLKEEHQNELDRIRTETAGEAMEKLAGILLDLDTVSNEGKIESVVSEVLDGKEEKGISDEESFAEPAPEPEEEEDEIISDEPWIESFKCTTCHECTQLNPVLFKYNEDKQAYIHDASAGTYKQLVVAAEKCPARCIHPGKPLNPDEPGLEDLIKRAESFN